MGNSKIKRSATVPKRIAPLSDVQIRNAKPKEQDYKLLDGYGLFLLITPTGGKLWRLDYRTADKRKTIALGQYPAVSLAEARQRREEARKLLAYGQDPAEAKKAQKAVEDMQATVAAATFELVAREWYAKNELVWSTGHAVTVLNRLNHDVFPCFGKKPVSDIRATDVRTMLLNIEARGAIATGQRVKVICGQVFRYAIATGRLEHDPSAAIKPADLFQKREAGHHAAITDPKALTPLLRAIDAYQGTAIVKAALQLLPLLFCRPGELQKMEWAELDLDAALWLIPGPKMKMKQPYTVPLSRQAVEILRYLQPLTCAGQNVFPGRTSTRPMSNMALTAALDYLGYKGLQSPHGFRATARTILDEVLGFRPDIIEHQLAHAVKDPNGRAYNRTAFLDDRRRMMQHWSDYLDGLKAGAKVIPITKAA